MLKTRSAAALACCRRFQMSLVLRVASAAAPSRASSVRNSAPSSPPPGDPGHADDDGGRAGGHPQDLQDRLRRRVHPRDAQHMLEQPMIDLVELILLVLLLIVDFDDTQRCDHFLELGQHERAGDQ